MGLTPGKLAGMRAVADSRGVIAALALDQRGILKRAIAHAKQADHIPDSVVTEFKELVTETLTVHASSILLDLEFGLGAAARRRRAGLFLAYERSSYDAAPPRLPALYNTWSVRRVKEFGADAVKVLVHYTPFEERAINDLKRTWVERIGDECRANDIPYVLELLSYDSRGRENSVEYAKIKPEIVSRSMAEFSDDRYGVDLLKVEVPAQMQFVAGTRCFSGEQVYSWAEAKSHFLSAASSTGKPFVYLSAGVSNAGFVETLEFAVEAGSPFSGVLCGRATWQDGIAIYAQHGPSALKQWLETSGTENIRRVNDVLGAAVPWDRRTG